ncbi:putative hydrolytic enzyme protein [Ilyonectria robusta]
MAQIVPGRESMSSIEHPRIVPDRVSYSCNGRCGAGCTGTALGNAYTQDCFSHDICSYFNNASGGARSDMYTGQIIRLHKTGRCLGNTRVR